MADLGIVACQEFCGRSKRAFLLIQSAETRSWGCFIFRKGGSLPD